MGEEQARALFLEQLGPHDTLARYGEKAAVKAIMSIAEPLAKLIRDLDDLIGSSEGIAGLHRNGDLAPWDSLLEGGAFESWLMSLEEARAALTRATREAGDDA